MPDNDIQKGYRPVQTQDSNGNRYEEKEKGAWHDRDLLPEERCCCSALQRFASPIFFCVLMFFASMFLGAVFTGTGGGVLSTIEKRFQLKTSEMAPFLIVSDTVNMVMVLFVAYYGHTSHRPRVIGAGILLMGFGCLLCTVPQFLYDPPQQYSFEIHASENITVDELPEDVKGLIYPVCIMSENSTGSADTEVCSDEEVETSGSLMWQASWIIVGQILAGIGAAPLSPLGVTYVDDCVDKSSTAVFLSILFICSWLGTFLGFGLSSAGLSLHAEFYRAPVGVEPGDPNWIGAWWLCYIIAGLMLIMIGVPVMLFPKKMRGRVGGAKLGEGTETTCQEVEEKTKANTEEDGNKDMHVEQVDKTSRRIWAHVQGFLGALRRLVTNIPFMSLLVGTCAMVSSVVSFFAFAAKYAETQFDLPASATPLLTGIMTTPGMLFGNLIGGAVVKKLELTEKGMARMMTILKTCTLFITPLFLVFGCGNRDIAGITANYPTSNSEMLPNLTTKCNSDCSCPSLYTPICGSDGVTYTTPCHAGCQATVEGMSGTNEGGNITMTIFTNCSCIGAHSLTSQTGLSEDYDQAAILGQCPRECNMLVPFVAIAIVNAIFGATIGIPSFLLKIRTVNDEDRSIAVGFSSMMVRLLATIPSPVIFSSVIQTACLLLQSSCGKTGNCLIYDIVHFRHAFFGLTLGLEVLCTILYAVCYFSIKNTEDPKEEPKTETSAAISRQLTRDSTDSKTHAMTVDDQDETVV